MRVTDLYDELERDARKATGGHVYRRLLQNTPFDIRFEVLATSYRPKLVIGTSPNSVIPTLIEMRGLSLSRHEEDGSLVIELTEMRLSQLFIALVEDLLDTVESLDANINPATAVLERLLLWHRLFSDSLAEGLTPEEQRGLFCELCFLRDFVLKSLPPIVAVSTWVAPRRTPQDFVAAHCWVEIKSRFKNSNTRVRISSEDQLHSPSEVLFLVVFTLDTSEDGLSLNDLIHDLHLSCSESPAAQLALSDSLIQYGYLDIHQSKYIAPKYLATPSCFRVDGLFPRITPSELRSGVSRVAYDIDLAACVPFSVSSDEIMQTVGRDHD